MSDSSVQVPPESFAPRPPLGFLLISLRGAWSLAGIQFLLGWVAFQLLTSLGWAGHLRHLAGSSSLPTYWGEFITSRDVWELLQHAGLRAHPVNLWTAIAGLVSLGWMLWFGWRMQAAAAGVRPGIRPWLQGFGEALLLSVLPLLALRWLVMSILTVLASTGIQGLGWLHLVGGALLHLLLGALFMLQWWICRLDLARPLRGRNAWDGYRRHLVQSVLQVWLHPIHWGAVLTVGAVVRAGVMLAVLALAWTWGGGSASRVAVIGLLMGAATLLNAWLIGWTLRLVAHFWRHDRRVRDEVRSLQSASR